MLPTAVHAQIHNNMTIYIQYPISTGDMSRGDVEYDMELMADGGEGDPSLPGRNSWNLRRMTAVSGSLQQVNLRKGAPRDQDWCEICQTCS